MLYEIVFVEDPLDDSDGTKEMASFAIDADALYGLYNLPSPNLPPDAKKKENKGGVVSKRESLMSPSSISLPNPPTSPTSSEFISSPSTLAMTSPFFRASTSSTAASSSKTATVNLNAYRRASTIVSSTYKRTKRSDALAQLEGRQFVGGYQFAPPHLNHLRTHSTAGMNESSFLPEEEDEEEEGDVVSFMDSEEISLSGGSASLLSLSSSMSSSVDTSTSTKASVLMSTSTSASASAAKAVGMSDADKQKKMRRETRTATMMLLPPTPLSTSGNVFDGPASRSSPALLLSTRQQSQLAPPPSSARTYAHDSLHLRSHSNPSTSSSSSTRTTSTKPHHHHHHHQSAAVPTTTRNKRTGPVPLSMQTAVTSSDASSFGCVGMEWSGAGFVSFIDSDDDEEDSSPSAAARATVRKEQRDNKKKEKEKSGRKKVDVTTANNNNSRRRGLATGTAAAGGSVSSFIDFQ